MSELSKKEIKARLRNAAKLPPAEIKELLSLLRKQPIELPQQEIEAMLNKSGQERYIYSVKRIAERKIAWTLKNKKELVLTGDENGNIYFPIWPFKEYALKCKIDAWKNCELKTLPLDNLLKEILPDLSKSGTKISVFIVPNDPLVTTVSADDFLNNLLYECSQYEWQ